MKRTLETILPTLVALNSTSGDDSGGGIGQKDVKPKVEVIVNGHYHETGGCHMPHKSEPGMNQYDIRNLLSQAITTTDHLHHRPTTGIHEDSFTDNNLPISFVGFPPDDPNAGWFSHSSTIPETRSQAEARASLFYLWLCEYLDSLFWKDSTDKSEMIFDAGVSLPEEIDELEQDKFSPRRRKRMTVVLVGHGDFIGLLLNRIVTGFSHAIENDGIPHRTAFIHYNTGITEVEYFGKGRFLIMNSNQTPHFNCYPNDMELLTSGGLKDGWSYIMPMDKVLLDTDKEVTIMNTNELDGSLKEQTDALRDLYSSSENLFARRRSKPSVTSVLKEEKEKAALLMNGHKSQLDLELVFILKRGMQVVGYLTYNEGTGILLDMVVRPSALFDTIEGEGKGGKDNNKIAETLMNALLTYAKQSGKEKVYVRADTDKCKLSFERFGFHPHNNDDDISEDKDQNTFTGIQLVYKSRL